MPHDTNQPENTTCQLGCPCTNPQRNPAYLDDTPNTPFRQRTDRLGNLLSFSHGGCCIALDEMIHETRF
jgi:hypothetical protein